MKSFFLLALLSITAQAHIESDATHRFPSFNYKGAKAVFVDFTEADYDITYDVAGKKANVHAIIQFNVVEEGYPVFDLIPDPTMVKIDGIAAVADDVSTPSNETTVRVLNKKLPVGSYELEINVPLTTLVEYKDSGVKNAFWVTDLEDRFYLERYIPTNLEYDRYKMTFNVEFKGLGTTQQVFANGKMTWINPNKMTIEYPDYFTVNSLYFHTTPVGNLDIITFTFPSVNGKQIPVTVYTAKSLNSVQVLASFKTKTISVMAELEADYGTFLHDSVTIYNASLSHMGLGGMEYAGATVTDIGSVSHELFHSYFARGVAPANGNAGWIDESLASWRDNRYNRVTSLSGSSAMAAHETYTRKTDTAAYSFGARFMAFLDGRFASKGGLKPFMNKLLEDRVFAPMFSEEFRSDMEKFYGEDLKDVFNTYIYKGKMPNKSIEVESHPIHKKMSLKDMYSIL